MYAVESMVKAGVKKIFFVITPDKLVFFQMPDNINTPVNHFIKLAEYTDSHEVVLGVFPSFSPNFFGRINTLKTDGLAKRNQKPPDTNTAVCSGIIKGSAFKELFLLGRRNFDQIINKNDPQQELRLSVLLSYYEQMAKNKFYYHYFKSGECFDIGDPKNLKKIICSLKKHKLIQ